MAISLRFGSAFDVLPAVLGCDEVRAALSTRLGFRRYRLFGHLTERSLLAAIPAPALPEGFTIRAAPIKSIRTLTNSWRREHHAGTTPPGPTEVSR